MFTIPQADRNSKRSSRKEGHDRSRRSEKEGHDRPRESDRRRTEREAPEGEPRHPLDRVCRFRTFHHRVAYDLALAWREAITRGS